MIPRELCKREGCGHPFDHHAPGEHERCRVTGCRCDEYLDKLPVGKADRARTLDEAADRLEAGHIVVLVPGNPEEVAFMELAVVRSIIGTPMAGDPPMSVVCVEVKK